jgi:hypothetical protein
MEKLQSLIFDKQKTIKEPKTISNIIHLYFINKGIKKQIKKLAKIQSKKFYKKTVELYTSVADANF